MLTILVSQNTLNYFHWVYRTLSTFHDLFLRLCTISSSLHLTRRTAMTFPMTFHSSNAAGRYWANGSGCKFRVKWAVIHYLHPSGLKDAIIIPHNSFLVWTRHLTRANLGFFYVSWFLRLSILAASIRNPVLRFNVLFINNTRSSFTCGRRWLLKMSKNTKQF